jgi:hypothetical protein
MSNENNGTFWSKKANDLVIRNLVRDVMGSTESLDRPDAVKGAQLTAEQTPNGTHNPGFIAEGAEPLKAAQLTKEQTPNMAVVLDSHIVEKSHANKTDTTKLAHGEDQSQVAPVSMPVGVPGQAPAPAAVPTEACGFPQAAGAPEAPAIAPEAPAEVPEVDGNPAEVEKSDEDKKKDEEDAAAVAEAGIAQNPEFPPQHTVEALGIRMASSSMGYGINLTPQEVLDLDGLFS